MTSGDTNSGDPYLLYCGSAEVIFWAKPKSQILMSSRAGCTIKMLEGYWAVREWVRPYPKEVTPRAARPGGTLRSVTGCPTKMVQLGGMGYSGGRFQYHLGTTSVLSEPHPPRRGCQKGSECSVPQSEQVLTGKLKVEGLCLPSLQAPGSHASLPGLWGMGVGKYLYVQVKDAMAVQVVQPLYQLLDVDLDLQWERLALRQESQPQPPPLLPSPPCFHLQLHFL